MFAYLSLPEYSLCHFGVYFFFHIALISLPVGSTLLYWYGIVPFSFLVVKKKSERIKQS